MKKFSILTVIFLLSLLGTNVLAQQTKLRVYQDEIGRYYLIMPEGGLESGPSIDRGVVDYLKKIDLAIDSPGKSIVVDRKESVSKYLPIFKKLVRFDILALRYNAKTENVSLVSLVEEKEQASHLLIFFLSSLLLMVLADIMPKKKEVFAFFLSLIASLSILLGVMLITHNYYFFALLACVFALISLIFSWYGIKIKYIIYRSLYYLALLIFLLLYFN